MRHCRGYLASCSENAILHGSVRAVAPRVIRAALHDRVAGFQVYFLRIEHKRDLAFKHKAEIERASFLHVRVRRRFCKYVERRATPLP